MSSIKPIKTLPITGITLTAIGFWPDDEGSYYGEDQFWQGGPAPQPVRFTLEGSITQQDHGSFSTPQLYIYNGLDIKIGDWYIEASTGKALRVTNIDIGVTNATYLRCTIEDVDRWEQFSDPTGVSATGADGFIVSLDDNGLPLFHNLIAYQTVVAPNIGFVEDMISRFRQRNLINNKVRVNQPGHTFLVGDSIILESSGNFSLADASSINAERIIGKVTQIGIPGVNWFNYEPRGKLEYDLSPALPGQIGDLVWLDPANPGKLTDLKPNSLAIPIYIKVDNTTGIKLFNGPVGPYNNFEATVDPTQNDDASLGYSYGSQWINTLTDEMWVLVNPEIGAAAWDRLNQIGPTGAGATGPTGPTGPTGYTGPVGPPAVGAYQKYEFIATPGQTVFPAAYVPGYVDVYYNGVRLIPTDYTATDANNVILSSPSTAGDPVEIIAWQIASISQLTGPTGVTGPIGMTGPAATGAYVRHEFVAFEGQTTFVLSYNVGFVDVYYNGTLLSQDQYTASNGTSIVLNNPAVAGDPVVFVAWEIATVSQLTGPTGPTGMMASFFFPDIAARNAVIPMVGQVCYVLDDGTGSNAMYIAASISPSVIWIPISIGPDGNNIGPQPAGDKRYVNTYTIDVAYDTPSPISMGKLLAGSTVSKVAIKVTSEFDSVSNITIGTVSNPSLFMSDYMSDTSMVATFVNEEQQTVGSLTDVLVYVSPGSSIQGYARIILTYH